MLGSGQSLPLTCVFKGFLQELCYSIDYGEGDPPVALCLVDKIAARWAEPL